MILASRAIAFLAVASLLACSPRGAVERQASSLTGLPPSYEVLYGFQRPLGCAGRLLAAPDGSLYGTACEGEAHGAGALFRRATDGTLTVLHHFGGGDGQRPTGHLARGGDGTLYGSTLEGGAHGFGTLFRYAAGTFTSLYSFAPADGHYPSALALDAGGALYGTTRQGGSADYGTLFRWAAGTGLTILHHFDRTTGSYPHAGVVLAADGTIYGTCDSGGAGGAGTLFTWQAGSGLTTLHGFSGDAGGGNPHQGTLVLAADGAIFGSTRAGGAGYGTLFTWKAGAGLTTLHAFDYYAEGGYPYGGLTLGSDGAFYGSTAAGGTGRRGSIFRWSAAQGLSRLHAFSMSADVDGAFPQWGVTQGLGGALYGSTEAGGAGTGVLWRVQPDGSGFEVLHRFGESEPMSPSGRVALGPDGALYGTSRDGGAHGMGTLYRVANGIATVLHSFDYDLGAGPEAGLVLGTDGAVYGTTTQGATGCGTLFKWREGAALSTLHVFARATTGCYPYGGVVQAADGAYYGTTTYGGANEAGTLFRWNGALTKLHDFAPATDGASPFYGGVVQGSDGALYGTTSYGGPAGGGTLFRWDGQYTVLAAFSSSDGTPWSPMAGVLQAADGALFGTASAGGAASLGALFKWDSTQGLVTLHSFTGDDGQYPQWPLMQRPDGMVWSIADTSTGGQGSLFQWDPTARAFGSALTITPAMGAYPSAWLVPGAGNDAYGTTWEGGPAGGGALFRLTFTPVDPCAIDNGGCDVHATCTNGGGSAVCTCNPGYSGQGSTCTDVDECLTGNGGCAPDATCTNTAGSRLCACHPGYAGDGVTCADVDECLTGNGGCAPDATCTNTVGSRRCDCNAGYFGDGLTCTAIAIASIQVTPTNPSIAKGTTLPFTATGVFTDNSVEDVTERVTWSTSAPAVATVSNAAGARGLAAGAGIGSATITATSAGVSGSTTLAVTAATLSSIEVTPTGASIAKGTTAQLAATGVYSDGTTQNLTTQVTWASSATSVALVSPLGLATGAGVGSTTITATLGGKSGATTLAVTAAVLTSVQVTPSGPSIAKGTTLALTATGIYSDGTTQNLTAQANWVSSATSIATISNAAGSQGLATGVGVGSSTITATSGGRSGATTLNVTAATLVALHLTPPTASLADGTTLQLTATGSYTDNTVQDLTTQVTWASSAVGIATISNASGSRGLATAVAVGATTITATASGVQGSASLSVTAAVLASIEVTPEELSIAKGIEVQLTATGVYTDDTTQDLTLQVTWTSSASAIATVSNAAGSKGLAHGVAEGTATVTAVLAGISGSTSLQVSAATLAELEIEPVDPSMAKGTSLPFRAIGTYTDDSTRDLTEAVTWSSSNATIATVSNGGGSKGRVSALAVGGTTITATLGSVSDSSDVTVTAAQLSSIAVSPATASIARGLSQQFVATGTYSDGTTQNLTTQVAWTSSAPTVASVSNATGSQGRATGQAAGSATITATLGGVAGSGTLAVTAAVLTSITVTPANPSVARTYKIQLTATGVYSDGTTQNLTAQSTWSSSHSRVTVSNATGSKGQATAVNTGTATLTASYSGFSGSTVMTVTSASLSSIAVTPSGTTTIGVGKTLQLTATGTFSNGTKLDITTQVTWKTSRRRTATVSSTGLVTGVRTSSNTVTMTASKSSRNGTTKVRVQ